MSNKKKMVIMLGSILLMIFLTYQIGYSEENKKEKPDNQEEEVTHSTFQFKGNDFTQPEQEMEKDLPVKEIPEEYDLATENEKLQLYVSPQTLNIMIKNKQTGYVWSSVPDESVLKDTRLNDEWAATVTSPVVVQYFNKDDMLKSGSYVSLKGAVEHLEKTKDGFRADFKLEELEVDMSIEVVLEEDSLVVHMPDETFKENGEQKIASVQLFPFLGAVKKEDIPGYMFIPDGSGALIRYQAEHPLYDSPYIGKIYGKDEAVESKGDWEVKPQSISVPVFGMVHGVKKNGFIGIVEKGKFNSEIVAYPSGVNTDFNWLSPRFIVRYPYFQPTSKSMGGINTFQKERLHEDKEIRYVFLSEKDSDYVGMAKTYREYLENNEQIKVSENKNSDEDVPVRVEFLGGEMEPGLIGNKLVSMTTFDQAQMIIDDLEKSGVDKMTAVYRGWSKGGLTGGNPAKFPVEDKLGGGEGIEELKEHLEKKGIPLYLYTNYTKAYGDQDNFDVQVDGVRRISNRILEHSFSNNLVDEKFSDLKINYMNPDKALEIASEDMKQFEKLGIEGVSIEDTGSILYSDHHSKSRLSREESASKYAELADTFSKSVDRVAFYQPNDYLFKYSDEIFSIPMSSSRYAYETDSVPFLQIVMHGSIDYYTTFSNYHADPKKQLLRMIEYGAYPSFYLTHEPSWKLQNTPSKDLFTSSYEDWSEDVVSQYKLVNKALKKVQNASIEDRKVIELGVVEVTYSNDVKIIVNYNTKEMEVNDHKIGALDFKLIEGGD
ncbi:DUF5696 domain-containing protein [Bacillus sp. Marseille-Q3570]|uniref:DUF5696 domain-containing protein n=1 Tax=Bacillus sp. Marseille-Q3570 TaxID=2963522 RepID=UPI0021B826ED|nr:DUF5696 domain-containing protein [Bacillus sp. Marseille-Q3570]